MKDEAAAPGSATVGPRGVRNRSEPASPVSGTGEGTRGVPTLRTAPRLWSPPRDPSHPPGHCTQQQTVVHFGAPGFWLTLSAPHSLQPLWAVGTGPSGQSPTPSFPGPARLCPAAQQGLGPATFKLVQRSRSSPPRSCRHIQRYRHAQPCRGAQGNRAPGSRPTRQAAIPGRRWGQAGWRFAPMPRLHPEAHRLEGISP